MADLRAGVIGLGVGRRHIAGFGAHPNCRVAAVCDFDDAVLAGAGRDFPGVRLCRDANEILDAPDIDIVGVASYDSHHFDHVCRAIRSGKHVFAEKPLCQTADQLREIRRLLNAHPDVRLSSNLNLRVVPRFRRLKQLVADGILGELFAADADYNYGRLWKITDGWRGQERFYSVVQGGGVHVIDLVRWLANDEVVEVTAFGNAIGSRGSGFAGPDLVSALLRFKNGLVARISANFACVYPHFHKVSLYGTAASFENGLGSGLLYRSRDPNVPPEALHEAYPGDAKHELIPNFLDAILTGIEPIVSADDVFRAMSICVAVDEAVQRQGKISVEYI